MPLRVRVPRWLEGMGCEWLLGEAARDLRRRPPAGISQLPRSASPSGAGGTDGLPLADGDDAAVEAGAGRDGDSLLVAKRAAAALGDEGLAHGGQMDDPRDGRPPLHQRDADRPARIPRHEGPGAVDGVHDEGEVAREPGRIIHSFFGKPSGLGQEAHQLARQKGVHRLIGLGDGRAALLAVDAGAGFGAQAEIVERDGASAQGGVGHLVQQIVIHGRVQDAPPGWFALSR